MDSKSGQIRNESKDQKKTAHSTSSTSHRGSNAANEKRDSHGRFESKDSKK